MRYLALGVGWYAAALAATAINPWLAIGPVVPNWLALVSLAWWGACGQARAVPWMALVGLSADLLANGPLGAAACAHALVGYGLVWLAGVWPQARRASVPGLAVLGWAVVAIHLLTVFVGSLQERTVPNANLFAIALGVGMYTWGVALPGWLILGWLREARQFAPAER